MGFDWEQGRDDRTARNPFRQGDVARDTRSLPSWFCLARKTPKEKVASRSLSWGKDRI